MKAKEREERIRQGVEETTRHTPQDGHNTPSRRTIGTIDPANTRRLPRRHAEALLGGTPDRQELWLLQKAIIQKLETLAAMISLPIFLKDLVIGLP